MALPLRRSPPAKRWNANDGNDMENAWNTRAFWYQAAWYSECLRMERWLMFCESKRCVFLEGKEKQSILLEEFRFFSNFIKKNFRVKAQWCFFIMKRNSNFSMKNKRKKTTTKRRISEEKGKSWAGKVLSEAMAKCFSQLNGNSIEKRGKNITLEWKIWFVFGCNGSSFHHYFFFNFLSWEWVEMVSFSSANTHTHTLMFVRLSEWK